MIQVDTVIGVPFSSTHLNTIIFSIAVFVALLLLSRFWGREIQVWPLVLPGRRGGSQTGVAPGGKDLEIEYLR